MDVLFSIIASTQQDLNRFLGLFIIIAIISISSYLSKFDNPIAQFIAGALGCLFRIAVLIGIGAAIYGIFSIL